MKPTPLSAVLADDLLLDRIGARLDTDDDLGSLLLAVAHRADTPIPAPARRVRRHSGLTVLAALGVAVSGATVAAAVELAPVAPDQASGIPHTRTHLPSSLQALVPFLSGTPFQGRLALPFGGMPVVPSSVPATAAEVTATALPAAGSGETVTAATAAREAQLDKQEQQDVTRQKAQAKGTSADGQGGQTAGGDSGDQGDHAEQGERAASEPKPTPTPTPTLANEGVVSQGNPAHGLTNGQATGIENGNGNGYGRGPGEAPTSGSTGMTGTTGTPSTAEDDPWSGAPVKGKGKVTTGTTTGPGSGSGAHSVTGTSPTGTPATGSTAGTTTETAATTAAPASEGP